MAWLLERHGELECSQQLLANWLLAVITKQQRESDDPLADPFLSAEDALKQMIESQIENSPKRRKAVQSYCLFPLVLLFVRRDCFDLLSNVWQRLSRVAMTSFEYEAPADYLEWRCEKGIERDFIFMQPQSWGELKNLAVTPPIQKLPNLLRSDLHFRLMFWLAFPHRMAWSIVGSLDHELLRSDSPSGFCTQS